MRTLHLISLLSAIFFLGCPKDESCTTCPPPDNTLPGKREYVWSIDSVDYGNLPSTIQLESIWGSSATDIWGAGYTPDVRDCLWHYDGTKWARATEGTPITVGGDGSKNVGIVWGIDGNDVWVFGNKIFSQPTFHGQAFVIHYDGSTWIEATGELMNLPSGIFDIFGESKNDFWLAAYENIARYNHGAWNKYKVGDSMLVWGITGSEEKVYAVAYDISVGGNKVVIARISNNQLSIDGETTLTDNNGSYNGKFEPSKLWLNNGKLYTAWHKISEAKILSGGNVDPSSWQTVLSLPAGQYFVNSFLQTSKNIFVDGYPNLLYHYNGTDWKNITISAATQGGEYSAVWTDGKEVIVCDRQNGIIYHGK